MKKVKLIYNPFSGDKRFKDHLDIYAEVFHYSGWETHLVRAVSEKSLDESIQDIDSNYALVAVAGGDGTVNLAVNALMRHGVDIPLGILPAGTANDFANFIKMPRDHRAAAQAIAEKIVVPVDLGMANDRYFINVCGVGKLFNVSQAIRGQFKGALGKLAYYLKGVGSFPNMPPTGLRITTASQVIEDEFFIVLALNSSGAGGIERLSATASIDDGLLDVLAFPAMSMIDAAGVFIKVLTGEHLEDRRVIVMREASIKIECIDGYGVGTDVDGESGPDMPFNISCKKGALQLIVPPQYLI